jgi:hypothetical protein
MYNANDPDRNELPSSAQLLKSTLVAFLMAALILVAIVLPAEYGIDPTGVGSMLGLQRMGEIKTQLAQEAEADAEADAQVEVVSAPLPVEAEEPEASDWRDETQVDVAPDAAIELKLVMAQGERAEYEWHADGGVLNFNKHGDGGGQSIEYGKGRGASTGAGELIASFDGHHGWFWRNRSPVTVALTLRTRGSYAEVKRTR